jgi:osmotically-inducible protein OsmY
MRTLLLTALLALGSCKDEDRQAIRERAELTWEEAARQSKYLVERGRDGTVVAWRETERVSGRAGDELTDAAILAAVKSRLVASKDVTGLEIDVDVLDRVVTLQGRVDNVTEAQTALAIALDTRGVDRVVSHLTY